MSLQSRFDTAIGNMALLSCGNSFSSFFHVVSLPHLPISVEFSSKITTGSPHIQIPNRQKTHGVFSSLIVGTGLHESGFGFDEILVMAVFLLFQHGIIHTHTQICLYSTLELRLVR